MPPLPAVNFFDNPPPSVVNRAPTRREPVAPPASPTPSAAPPPQPGNKGGGHISTRITTKTGTRKRGLIGRLEGWLGRR